MEIQKLQALIGRSPKVKALGRLLMDESMREIRLDGLVAEIYHLSRSQSLTLFREKRVFVNGRLMENNSRSCKPGEVVNVRGFGKFIYDGIGYTTKKGKQRVRIRIYR